MNTPEFLKELEKLILKYEESNDNKTCHVEFFPIESSVLSNQEQESYHWDGQKMKMEKKIFS